MNKIFKVIWDKIHQCFIVVSELCTTRNNLKCIVLASTLVSPLTQAALSTIPCSDSSCTIDDIIELSANWDGSGNQLNIGHVKYGQLNITNGANINSGNLIIGENYDGKINIINGGRYTVQSNDKSEISLMSIGSGENTTGTLNISGSGSEFIYNHEGSEINVGYGKNSHGIININDGGKFLVQDNSNFYIGGRNGGYGEINIAGPGSKLSAYGSAILGTWGDASLNITEGASAEFTNGIFTIAYNGNGNANVSGEGSSLTANKIIVGRENSHGSLTVNDGAIITSGSDLIIAEGINSDGHLIIGSKRGESIQKAGTINSSSIEFGKGKGLLTLNHNENNYILNSNIIGNGVIESLHGTSTLSGDNTLFTGNLITEKNAQLIVGQQKNLGDATLLNEGTVSLYSNQDWHFTNTISGSGVLDVNTNNHIFSFSDSNATTGFSGTLALSDTKFDLSGTNASSLLSGGLRADAGSQITTGTGIQTIGHLAFSGGTMRFGSVTPGLQQTDTTVHINDNLDLSGSGAIEVDATGVVNTVSRTVDNTLSILEQDDSNASIKLISVADGATVLGDAGGLQLRDLSGQVISSALEHNIVQDGQVVALGSYDYRLTSGENQDGLYVSYGLSELDLLGKGNNALVLNANGNTGNAADLSATLTGNGDLIIDTGSNQTITLSGSKSTYTGDTFVRSGLLQMASNNALGQTANLSINSGAAFKTDGYNQKVGALNTEKDSRIQLDSGSVLTIDSDQRQPGDSHGGVIENTVLSGTGTLAVSGSNIIVNGANAAFNGDVLLNNNSQVEMNGAQGLGNSGTIRFESMGDRLAIDIAKESGLSRTLSKSMTGMGSVEILNSTDLTLSGDNTDFSGELLVQEDAVLRASDAQNLGTGLIASNGITYLTSNNSWDLLNDITGTGNLVKQGGGKLIVNHELTYTGDTTVESGVLVVGDNSVTRATEGKLSGSQNVKILKGATLSGAGSVSGHVDNQGILASLNAISDYEATEISKFNVSSLNNAGTILLAGGNTGNKLTVNGEYTGGGTLVINTVLGDDNSVTDKLIVTGDTSGNTDVIVNSVQGNGAQTANGIEVVHVDGQSEGQFKLINRAIAGAYEYFLHEGGVNSDDGNWYLRSELTTPEKSGQKVYRPEAGSYIANIASANTLFSTRMHDREGETYYTDVFTGEQKTTSMWMRHVGGHNRWKDSTSQLSTQSNRYAVQLGGNIAQWTGGQDRLQLGIMAGYGNEKSTTTSSLSGYKSRGSINGYSTGVYGTWQQNYGEDTGAYVDTWLQYNWFDNSVSGERLASESWKSRGFTASTEAGYTLKTGEFTGSKGSHYDWYIQPQSQVTWMNVRARDHIEKNGSTVNMQGDGNIQTRLGVRTYLKGKSAVDGNKASVFEPFAELNLIHNTRLWGVQMGDTTITQGGTRNIGEVKTGLQGKLSNSLNVWGSISTQIGDKGYSDTQATLGIKYLF